MKKPGFVSLLAGFVITAAILTSWPLPAQAAVNIYPAPAGEPLSSAYKMQVGGHDVPVYQLKVAPQDKTLRFNAVDIPAQNGVNFEPAAFAYLDADSPVTITVTFNGPVTAARLLPETPAIPVKVQGSEIQFTVNGPQNLTLEVNHQLVRTLHVFVNPIETGAPSPKDPQVMYFAPGAHQLSSLQVPAGKTIFYFGPGTHTVDNLVVHSGQSVYIAGGAIVQGVIRQGEKSSLSHFNTPLYADPVIKLVGSNVAVRGRGILDGTPSMGKRLLTIQGQNITLDGVILKNAGSWFMPIYYSDHVTVSNLKILGYRANTDGIDVYNSRDVTIQGCFVRTVDDIIVIKTRPEDSSIPGSGPAKNITVTGNRLWNETGSAIRIGTEVGADISTVEFNNNDVIRDLSRGASESIYLAGSGTVSNVRFENNRIDRTGNAADKNGQSSVIYIAIKHSLWEASADKSASLGKVTGILYSNTQVTTEPGYKMLVELLGASPDSNIESVKFEGITVDGKPMSKSNVAAVQKFTNQIVGLP